MGRRGNAIAENIETDTGPKNVKKKKSKKMNSDYSNTKYYFSYFRCCAGCNQILTSNQRCVLYTEKYCTMMLSH